MEKLCCFRVNPLQIDTFEGGMIRVREWSLLVGVVLGVSDEGVPPYVAP